MQVGHQYALSLSADASMVKTSLHRVGIMVADSYPFGRNNFQVDGYDYAFKTFMATEEAPVVVEKVRSRSWGWRWTSLPCLAEQ